MTRLRRPPRWLWLIAPVGLGVVAWSLLSHPARSAVASRRRDPAAGRSARSRRRCHTTKRGRFSRRFNGRLPESLTAIAPADRASAWPGWVRGHDAAVRARLDRGDEDSLVNFWLYGTSFTKLPRATAPELAQHGGRAAAEALLVGRLTDLVAGLAAPTPDERLRFARQVIERRGIDPSTAPGQEQARRYLVEVRERVVTDTARYRQAAHEAGKLSARTRPAGGVRHDLPRSRPLVGHVAAHRFRRRRDAGGREDQRPVDRRKRPPRRDHRSRPGLHRQGGRLRLLPASDDSTVCVD